MPVGFKWFSAGLQSGALGFAGEEVPARPPLKKRLAALTPQQITLTVLAGERIESVLSHAPGNGESIDGIKFNTAGGWFAAGPSGTEGIYKICAESFVGPFICSTS